MRLLFDENLSPRLVDELATEFPGSLHVRSVGLRGSDDVTIWKYAGKHSLVIVSKDNDFRQLSFLKGLPPKIVWLSVGNAGTESIAQLLRDQIAKISAFNADPETSLLPLEGPEKEV